MTVWMPALSALLFSFVVLFAAKRLGRLCLAFYWTFSHSSLRYAAEMALGLAGVSYAVFALAAAGWVTKTTLSGLLLLLVPFAAQEVYAGIRKLSSRGKQKETAGAGLVWQIAVGFYAVWILLGWILPETARDALIYHLQVPKVILQNRGFSLMPDNVYAYFPQLADLFFVLGLGTAGELGAKVYHPLFGLVLATGLYGYVRQYVNRSQSFLAVLLFLTVPSVMVILPSAYVDLAFSLYAFLGFVFVLTYLEKQKIRWLVLAGIMTGCSTAVKYTGIQYLLLLTLFILGCRLKTWNRRDGIGILVFIMLAVLVPAPYFIRNFILTGWPLFPFSFGNFPLHAGINWDLERAGLYLGWLGQFGIRPGADPFWHTLLAPVFVFIKGEFNRPEFYEGILGPVFLTVPLLWFRLKKDAAAKQLLVFSLLFLFTWTMTTKQSRFLIPLLPVLCVLIVRGLSLHKRVLFSGLVLLLMLNNAGMGIYQGMTHEPWHYWSGAWSKQRYLSRQIEPYKMYEKANEMLSESDRVFLLNMKNYLYYLRVPARSDYIFEGYTLGKAEILAEYFAGRGVNALMVDEVFIRDPRWGMEPEGYDQFQVFLNQYAKRIAGERHYSLYRLDLSS